MIKISMRDIRGLKPKTEQGEALIHQFKRDLEALSEKDATTEYILKHVLAIIQLSQGLEEYIFKHARAIMNPMRSAGREALADQVEALFAQASQMDFEKIQLESEQAYQATGDLLKIFEGFQALFPKHDDEHLQRVVTVLGEKISAYKLSQQAEHEVSEENASVYVLSEPETPINDLSKLFEYVATEFGNIDEISDLNLKIAGYQALEEFTIRTFITLQDIHANQEIANQLLQKIIDAHKVAKKALDTKITQVIDKHKELIGRFKSFMDAVSDQYKKHIALFQEADALIENLNQVSDELKSTKDMTAFKKKTQVLLDGFSARLEQNPDAKCSWFQKYITQPFQQFKMAIITFIESIYKTTPNGSTPQHIGFFSQDKVKEETKQIVEVYKNELQDIGDEKSPTRKPG